jgi:hypothetical protein
MEPKRNKKHKRAQARRELRVNRKEETEVMVQAR